MERVQITKKPDEHTECIFIGDGADMLQVAEVIIKFNQTFFPSEVVEVVTDQVGKILANILAADLRTAGKNH